MTEKLAKWLITLAQTANGIGAFIVSADRVPFGLDASDVGLSLIWVGTFATIAVLAIRQNLIPGVTTGVGREQPPTWTFTATTSTNMPTTTVDPRP